MKEYRRLVIPNSLVLAAAGWLLSSPAVGQDYTPVLHSQLQAVNIDGSSFWTTIHPTSTLYPVALTGVVINNPADMLDASSEWQVFVQATQAGDFGGTALYMRKQIPWDPGQDYTDAEWASELDRIHGLTLRYGDIVSVQAKAPGLFYNGMFNINEQHQKSPNYDFSITVLGHTTPIATSIALSALKDPGDNFIFNASSATGCEHYQGSLVHLDNLLLTDPGDWGLGNTVTVRQGNLTFPMQLGLDSGLASVNATSLSSHPFSVTAIVNQDTGNYTSGYSLWLTNSSNFTPAMAGDANGDGTVNINDLSKVLTNYDKSTGMSWSSGDFNGDGTVDINDLSIVLTNYDKTAGAATAGMTAVPEPGTLATLAAGLAALLFAYRCVGGKSARQTS